MNPQDQQPDPSQQQPQQPGQVLSPQGQMPNLPAPVPQTPAATPEGGFYHPPEEYQPDPETGEPIPADMQMFDNGREVVWTASEFVSHEKSPGWYLAMIGIALVIIAIVYFVTKDIFTMVIVTITAIIFGIVAARPPRQMQYGVSDHGIQIGRRFYPYKEFRSFSVLDEGAFGSITFMPLKRFMPPLSIYFDPADEEIIGDMLLDHLPFAEHQRQLTERLMRRIRF